MQYNAEATDDDGTCIYGGDGVTFVMYDSYGDGWNGNTLTIAGQDLFRCMVIASTNVWTIYADSLSFDLCLDLTQCTEVTYNGWGLPRRDVLGNLECCR